MKTGLLQCLSVRCDTLKKVLCGTDQLGVSWHLDLKKLGVILNVENSMGIGFYEDSD